MPPTDVGPNLPAHAVARLRVLGTLEVVQSAESAAALPMRSPRLRRLLAALAVRAGSVASVDWLSDVVWGDDVPSHPGAALQSLVSRLRAALPADADDLVVLTRSPGYLLTTGPNALDSAQFEQMVARARREREADPVLALATYEEALALWRGPAYAEFADEPFARPEAARLEELRVTAVEDLIETALRLGRLDVATPRLEALTAQEPFRERPHALLMLARYQAGDQAEALRVFRDYRERLDEALGLTPSREILQLESDILRHEVAGPAPPVEPAAPDAPLVGDGTTRRTGQPRVPAVALHGRQTDLSWLAENVRPGRGVTLVGPGGVGKTSLALNVVAAAASDSATWPDGAWVCELAAVSGLDGVVDAVTTLLEVPPRLGTGALERLVEYVGSRTMLLLLDNCEHVLDAAAAVTHAVRRSCPGAALLATSRQPLDVEGEVVRAVWPLDAPPATTADPAEIGEAPSVRLFVERAQAQVQEFDLDESNAVAVAELCRRLDGLPLAIELAAVRMRTMNPDELARRLSGRFRLLHGGVRSGGERHRTLRAVVGWSYDLLDEPAQRAFETLSVFAGSFTLDAAAAVVASCLDDLTPDDCAELVLGLVERSMVVVATTSPMTRYTLLETLRAYGLEQLEQRGGELRARRAHAEHVTAIAQEANRHLFGERHVAAVVEISAELAELRSAHTWALEHDLELAVRLVGSMAIYVEHTISAEVGRWADRTLDLAAASAMAVPGLARAYAVAAGGAKFGGELGRARDLAERGRALSDAAGGGDESSYLRLLLAEVALFDKRFDDAERWAAECAGWELADRPDHVAAITEQILALVAAHRDDPSAGAALAAVFQQRAERAGSPIVVAWAQLIHGEVLIDLDPKLADELLTEALDCARRIGDHYLGGVALVGVAKIRSRHGDPTHAVPLYLDVIEHWRRAGDWVHQWTTLRYVVDLLIRLGRWTDAAVVLGACASRYTSGPALTADERTTTSIHALIGELGAERTAELRRRGELMTDDQVVTFALAALRQARPEQSVPRDEAMAGGHSLVAPLSPSG